MTRAVDLTPFDHDDRRYRIRNLGAVYHCRFKHTGNLDDMDNALMNFMAANVPNPKTYLRSTTVMCGLSGSYFERFEESNDPRHLDKAIEWATKAVKFMPNNRPGKPQIFARLSIYHIVRFSRHRVVHDLDKAVAATIKAVTMVPQDADELPLLLCLMANCYHYRSQALGHIKDLDSALDCIREAHCICDKRPEGVPPYYPRLLRQEALINRCLFQHDEDPERINQAIECQTRAISLTSAPRGGLDDPKMLASLALFYLARSKHLDDLTDYDRATQLLNQAVASKEHHDSLTLSLIGDAYMGKFKYLPHIRDLDLAISYLKQSLPICSLPIEKLQVMLNLGECYMLRGQHSQDQSSSENARQYFQMATKCDIPSSIVEFQAHAAVKWWKSCADLPLLERMHASRKVVEYMQKNVRLEITIGQQFQLASRSKGQSGDVLQGVAAVAIEAQKYNDALEWCEQGRSTVWSKALQLRVLSDDLR
ncbi:hypothetical protein FRC11_003625, partial [Ceratobasidium sp. 423]